MPSSLFRFPLTLLSPISSPGRNKRLAEAEAEAKQEIDAYRAELEADYQKFISEQSGDGDGSVEQIRVQKEKDMKSLEEQANGNRSKVESLLLHKVTTVNLTVSDQLKQSVEGVY